jgi:hypothetical protein
MSGCKSKVYFALLNIKKGGAMRKKDLSLLFCFIISASTTSSAVNELSVQQAVTHPTVIPGYIDEATLVVEPYGGYSLQSLYIKYSDHGLCGDTDIIIHNFEMPAGAVATDLWLWIGDSVMQAKILERRQAQGIWDTLVMGDIKHDPAFLTVTENQYNLQIFPLKSGSYRKVKISFMVPTQYTWNKPVIFLPYKFLRADNNPTTLVKVLFRTLDTKWGIPSVVEDSLLNFSITVDTLGKRYKVLNIPNIKKYANLTLSVDGRFVNGWTSDFYKTSTSTYFSFGMYEPEFFYPPICNGHNKKSFIGLDLSGIYGVDSATFFTDFTTFLSTYLHNGDFVRIAMAGEGLLDSFPAAGGWYSVDSTTVSTIQTAMTSGGVLSAKKHAVKPKILFSDGGDGGDLYFSGVGKLATYTTGSSLFNNRQYFNQYDIVTTYWHSCPGHEILSNSQLDILQASLDAFFEDSGVFVLFYAYNRDSNNIARRYFDGLIKPTGFFTSTLHRNIDGPIGHGFPSSIYYYNSAPLLHSDTAVINEVLDDSGKPVVISKKIRNGRFIISSLWHKSDALGTKKILCTPLLNLQNQSKYFQLPDILNKMIASHRTYRSGESVLMSNADFLITKNNLAAKIGSSILTEAYKVPIAKTVNLLDGVDYIPPVYFINSEEYYGSSYSLRSISDSSLGSFYSRHQQTWDYISQQFAQPNKLTHDSFDLHVEANDSLFRDSIYDCNSNNIFFNDAHFYVGKTTNADTLTFFSAVKYTTMDSIFSRVVSAETNDSLSPDTNCVTLYQVEVLKRMLLADPFDTTAVINFAVQNRLLTDVTAFIALEPDDTTHFMTDPKDESDIGPRTRIGLNGASVSKELFVFMKQIINNQISFTFSTCMTGTVVIKIFNLMGREITGKVQAMVPEKPEYFTCPRGLFARGVYIVVAQYTPDSHKVGVQRKIERFTIR